jgi:hypothetical protein
VSPQRDRLVEIVDAGQREARGEDDHDQRAEQGADHAAAAAEQARATDHYGGDALQVRVDRVVRAGRACVPDRHPGCDADDQPGEDVDREEDAVGPDARESRCFGVVADRVYVTAPLCPGQDVVDDQVEAEDHDHAVDQVQRADLQRITGPVEDGGHLGRLGGLALRVDQPDGRENAQRPQRHDEWRQPDAGDQRAVDHPGRDANQQADQQGDRAGKVVVRGQLGHVELGEDHRRADGQVDPGGQDDHCLGHAKRCHHCDLLKHERDVLGRDESRVEEPEHDAGKEEHDEWAQCGMGVQWLLYPVQRRGPGTQLLELLLRREGCRHIGHGLP